MPIYGVPHFDFHFYLLTPGQRQAITAEGADLARNYQQPDSALIPAGYVLAPDSAEARQGSHWIDPKAAEFQGQPHGFDQTFIYGFYEGKLSFLEPMISKAFLESHANLRQPIHRPARYSKPGLYPSQYQVSYDPQTREYSVVLEQFE